MEALDSGHTTVKTENRDGQPGLNQGQDPSSRVLLRSTRVATRRAPGTRTRGNRTLEYQGDGGFPRLGFVCLSIHAAHRRRSGSWLGPRSESGRAPCLSSCLDKATPLAASQPASQPARASQPASAADTAPAWQAPRQLPRPARSAGPGRQRCRGDRSHVGAAVTRSGGPRCEDGRVIQRRMRAQ